MAVCQGGSLDKSGGRDAFSGKLAVLYLMLQYHHLLSFQPHNIWKIIEGYSSFITLVFGAGNYLLGESSQLVSVVNNHGESVPYRSGCSPSKWPFMAYKMGMILTTYKSWDAPPSTYTLIPLQNTPLPSSFFSANPRILHRLFLRVFTQKPVTKVTKNINNKKSVTVRKPTRRKPWTPHNHFFPVEKEERYLNFERSSSWRYTCSTEPWLWEKPSESICEIWRCFTFSFE